MNYSRSNICFVYNKMEAVLRWVCSFKAYKAKVQLHTTTATCGDTVLLCSIKLTDPKSTFKDYENKIAVLYGDRNSEVGDCKVDIKEINSQQLDIYCNAHRAGIAKVRLDLGKWYYFADEDAYNNWSYSKDVDLQAFPSTPHCLSDIRFTTDGLIDKSFSVDPTVMYRKRWSILEANIVDRYGNIVEELSNDHDICLELFRDEGKKMEIEYKNAKIRNGRLRVQVRINDATKDKLLITLTSKSSPDQVFHLKEIQVQVDDASFYLAGSKFHYPDTCVAGKKFRVEILPFDVFGYPLPANSTTDYNLIPKISDSPLRMNRIEETIDSKVSEKESNIRICFSVVLTKSGSRKLMIFDKDNKQKELSFEVNPDVDNVHWEHTSLTDTAYRRENLFLTVHLLDRFNNEVRNDSSENIPNLLKQAGPDGFHCAGKSMQNNIGTIQYRFKQTGTYELFLANQDGCCLEGTSFTVVVEDAPLDHRRSSITWLPKYDDFPDQPVFPDDELFRCCLKLKDVLGYKYKTKIPKECFQVRYGRAKVENITVSSSANEFGSYIIVVPLSNIVRVDPSPRFLFLVNGVEIENPLVLPTFVGLKQYNDENFFVDRSGKSLEFLKDVRHYVKENDMIAHKIGINSPAYKLPPEEIENKIRMYRDKLVHLLRAIYYRQEAFDADEARKVWRDRASKSYNEYSGDRPHFCKQIKKKYAKLMEEYHKVACEEFFTFFNAERGQSEIDLHGLLVVDETKLQRYKQQLYERGELNHAEVEREIKEQRDIGNEAIRKLRERLEKYNMGKAEEEGEPWLEIIVGAGHHSKVRQQIRPKVEDYLRQLRDRRGKKLEFKPVNKGALVVTFETYSGTEPCFGEYYCTRCNHPWRNGRSWIGKWQACYKCYKERGFIEECYPIKQRKKWTYYRNTVPRRQKQTIPHLKELCEKCRELGRLCS